MDDTNKTKAQLIAELEELRIKNDVDKSVTINTEEFLLNSILLDNLPCIALVLKKKTREIVASNKAARDIGAVPGETCFGICAERDDPCPFCRAPELWSTDEPKHIEVEYRGKYYEGIWVPLSEDLYVHYIFDISERKKTEEELKLNQYYLEKAQQIGRIGSWELDLKINKLIWTDENYKVFEVPLGTELTYEIFLNCVHPDDREYVNREWKAALNGEPYDIEHRLILDGNIKWVREKAEIEFDKEGNCIKGIGFTQDITERKKIENALRKSQEQYHLLFENMQNAFALHEIVLDEKNKPVDYIFIDVNNEFEKQTGLTKESIVGKRVTEVLPGIEKDSADWIGVYGEVALTGKNISFENYSESLDEWYNVIAFQPVHGQFATIFSNITERKKAEEEINNLSKFPSENPNPVLRISKDGVLLYANPSSSDVLKNCGLKVGKKLPKKALKTFNEIIKDNAMKTLEFPVDDRLHSITITPFENYFNIYGLDITERKKAEEALIKIEHLYSTTINSLHDAIHVIDLDYRIILHNERLENWSSYWGLDKEIDGKSLFELYPFIPENSVSEYEQVATENKTIITEESILLKGQTIEVETIKIPVVDKGKVIRIITVVRDITERKQLEEERAKASKLESIGLLAGGIAHDFNNILAAILGNTSLAKLKVDSSSQEFELLTETENAAVRATKLTQQLLTFAKGGAPLKETTELVELIRETTGFSLRGSNVQYRTSIAPDLWTADVDKGQISQVIGNLVINAQQAMPDGGTINVKAENVKVTSKDNLPLRDGNYIKISVTDKGKGITAEQLTKIFDPYFTTKQMGSGLGLATVYSIIHRHNGHIGVESKVGTGTTFTIYLPASSKKVNEKKTAIDDSEVFTGKILVMDDDEMLRKMVVNILKNSENEVVEAVNGAIAINLYKKAMKAGKPFDVVIMDLTIPGGMGGKEAIKKLLEIDPDAKAIVSSGYANDPVVSNFDAYGFKGYIPKPYKLEELKKVLNEVLSDQQ